MFNARHSDPSSIIDAIRDRKDDEYIKDLVKKLDTPDVEVKGETPLIIALRYGRVEIVRALLSQGANPNFSEKLKVNPMLAAFHEDQNVEAEILFELICAGVSQESIFQCLILATSPEVIKLLEERMMLGYIPFLLNRKYKLEKLPYLICNSSGQKALVIYLAENGRFDLIHEMLNERIFKPFFLTDEEVIKKILVHLEQDSLIAYKRLDIVKAIKKFHPAMSHLNRLEQKLSQDSIEKDYLKALFFISECKFTELTVLISLHPLLLQLKDKVTLLEAAYELYKVTVVDEDREEKDDDAYEVPWVRPMQFEPASTIAEKYLHRKEILLYLLEKSDIKQSNFLLHSAVKDGGSFLFIALLLLCGADIETRDERDKKPLDYLKQEEEWNEKAGIISLLEKGIAYFVEADAKTQLEKMLDYLSSSSLKTKCLSNLLTDAVRVNNLDLVKYLISKLSFTEKNMGVNAFILATELQNKVIINIFLEHGMDINAIDDNGNTALITAFYKNNSTMWEFLIEHKADVNIANRFGVTPILICSQKGSLKNMKYLLRKNANPNVKNNNHDTPLLLACKQSNIHLVKQLLLHGANSNCADATGLTPLHIAALNKNFHILQELLDAGAEVDLQDKNGNSPLHTAARWGSTNEALLLLDHGADPNIKNKKNETPLMFAAQKAYQCEQIIRYLKTYGADISMVDNNGLRAVDHLSNQSYFRPLLQYSFCDKFFAFFSRENTIKLNIIIKTKKANIETVKKMVESMPDILSRKMPSNESPLLHLAYSRRLSELKKLRETKEISLIGHNGIRVFSLFLQKATAHQVNVRDSNHQSLLHHAVKGRAPLSDIILLLLRGVEDTKDGFNQTAYDYINSWPPGTQDMDVYKKILKGGKKYLLEHNEWLEKYEDCPNDILKKEVKARLKLDITGFVKLKRRG